MPNTLAYVNCAICNKNDTEVFLTSPGLIQIVKCRNDGFLFLNPRPTTSHLGAIFKEYVPNIQMFTDFRRAVLKREARAIKQMKSRGRLLDVGCSVGTFFENFSTDDWMLYGVELSQFNVNESRGNYGADVFCGNLHDARYQNSFFDVITVLDTIYFFPDLRSNLFEIRRCLKDDGILAIEIEGYNYWRLRDKGLICWMLDRKWTRLSPRRLYYFSPGTLKRLLEEVGYRVVNVVPEQASLGRTGLAQALNSLHFMLARLLFYVTRGRVSIAGRELYLARKLR